MRKVYKRVLAVCIVIVFLALISVGCSKEDKEDNVFTVNACKTRYVPKSILDKVRKEYPEMEIRVEMYGGANFTLEAAERLDHYDIPDLFVTTRNDLEIDTYQDNLLDLSSYEVLNRYITQAIDSMNMNGSVYFIPNFTSLTGLVYDKNVFREHGWKAPHSYEELVSLCEQVEKTGIQGVGGAWDNPSAYSNVLACTMAADFYSTPEGTTWFYDFVQGKAKGEGVIEPYIANYIRWYEDGIFDYEIQENRAVQREKFDNGEIAMMYGLIGNFKSDDEHDYGLIPFFKTGTDEAYYPTATAGYFALNKKLGEKGNEKKLEVGLRILDLLSTEEGQKDMMRGDACYSFLRGFKGDLNEITESYQDVVGQNHFAPMNVDMNTLAATATELIKMLEGELTQEEYIRSCDDIKRNEITEAYTGEYLFTAKENFTEKQTVQYFAAALQDYAGTQIGMVTPSVNEQGEFSNPMTGIASKFYKGDIYSWPLTRNTLTAIDGTSGWAKMSTGTISGETLYELLEDGICWKQAEDRMDNEYYYDKGGMTSPFYYETAGLDVEFTSDHKIKSIQLNDGTPVKKSGSYTIATLHENVPDNYLEDLQIEEEETILEIAAKYGKTGMKGDKNNLPMERDLEKEKKN
ncbi:5'-nucleotidase C-terminal domain-containing protein [Faecalicatena faecalis]|uniref:5'-nucleotidase C-terminal domain-containing protein n=1 Tax=Faecalicatena faecalis TaxID=2726362 RepID=UPI001C0D5314|nr:5'-nucleotidase C-terminal domain-containing protein [Faecalicatena faecalis]